MSFKNFLKQSKGIHKLMDLIPEDFKEQGWKGVVLDFDGVLASFNKQKPDLDIIKWVHQLSEQGIFVAIHSNNNRILEEKRQSWLRRNYPDILWMSSRPYKPNPSTLIHLKQRWKLEGSEIVMIDDRLLTGGKAAYRAGCSFLYIADPLVDRAFEPFAELWLGAVRWIERLCYQCPEQIMRTREDSNL